MLIVLLIHILPGLTGIASGGVALFAAKGATLHRQSGLVFVAAMLIMATSGAVMGALRGEVVNVIAGTLTFYLVSSALLTVRPHPRWLDLAALLVALGVVAICAVSLLAGRAQASYTPLYVIFGGVALLAAVQDAKLIAAGGAIGGTARVVRHLWRMCLALFIATGSFFLGQSQVFPEPIRSSGLLALPVLLVLVLMVYHLLRVSLGKQFAQLGQRVEESH